MPEWLENALAYIHHHEHDQKRPYSCKHELRPH